MPVVHLSHSALAGDGPSTISYRTAGEGHRAIVFLHGGWGCEVYPFDAPAQALARTHRVLTPDRSGHGGSSPIATLPLDFHRRGAAETVAFLDAMELERAVWWGHSDGAVIAATAAIEHPDRVEAVVLEALHLRKAKPRSRTFFEQMADDPDAFGPTVKAILERDHGARWRDVLRLDGRAWLDLAADADANANANAASSAAVADDLYGGRLPHVTAPVLIVHGGADPRSEAGELDAICAALPHAALDLHPAAGHSPHSETATAALVAAAGRAFIDHLADP